MGTSGNAHLSGPRQAAYCVLIGAAGLFCNCTTLSPARPFADVRASVQRRSGYRIEWNRSAPGAAEVTAAVDALLTQQLTADAAVQVALLNNRRLQAEYTRLGVSQAALVQAGLLKNPVFQGVIRWAPDSQRIFDFSIVQDFLDVLLLPLQVSVAQAELEAVKLDVAGRVIDLAADTKREFYTYVKLEQAVALAKATLLAAESSYEMAGQLRAAGNITELDLLNEQAAYERAKLELAHAEADVVSQRERLNRLMGLWGSDTVWTAVKPLPAVPAPAIVNASVEPRALAANLDLEYAYQQIAIAARRYQVDAVMRVIPTFDLGGNIEFEKEETFRLVEHRRRDGNKYALEEIPGPTEIWSGGQTSLALPIFDWGQATAAAGRAEIERLYERYTALAIEVRSAAREAAFRAANAKARADFQTAVFVPLRETITAETQLRYNAMFDGVFQLLRAKEREIEARREEVEARHAYWIAHTDLEQLLMGRLPPPYRQGLRGETDRGFGREQQRPSRAGESDD